MGGFGQSMEFHDSKPVDRKASAQPGESTAPRSTSENLHLEIQPIGSGGQVRTEDIIRAIYFILSMLHKFKITCDEHFVSKDTVDFPSSYTNFPTWTNHYTEIPNDLFELPLGTLGFLSEILRIGLA